MKLLLKPALLATGATMLFSVLSYGKTIQPLVECNPYTKLDEAAGGPQHYHYRPIGLIHNDPTEHDGKFKRLYYTLYGHDLEFSVYWGNGGKDDPSTMIQMTAEPTDGKPSLQSQFVFEWILKGGATYSYKLGWDSGCVLSKGKVPFSYHDVTTTVVKVKETTCRGLGCGKKRAMLS